MDASEIGLGVVISQIQDGKEPVIAFASHTLNKAEGWIDMAVTVMSSNY